MLQVTPYKDVYHCHVHNDDKGETASVSKIEVPLHNHMMGNYATMKGSDLDPFEDMEETHCKNIKLKSSQKN